MANTRLTALTGLSSPATGDYVYIVDISDTTDNAAGSSRKITAGELIADSTFTFTNKTINLASNTLTGTTAEFNTALSDGNFATLAGTETLTNKTLTTPKFADGGYIADTSGNELLAFDSAATAVNHVGIISANASSEPGIEALGGDTDVGLIISAKGAGELEFFTDAFSTALVTMEAGGDVDLEVANANIQVAGVDPYRTITLTPGFIKPTTTSGCAAIANSETSTNKINYDTLDFDTSSEEHAYCNVAMPDSWDAGVIQFRATWTASSGTGGVAWGLSGRSFADDDALDQAVGTEVVVTDTLIATGDQHKTAWSSDVTITGAGAGEEIYLEIARVVANGSDTLNADAKLKNIQVRYKQAQYSD